MHRPFAHRAALLELIRRVSGEDVVWALTGSQSHSLQGVPLDVHDIDVQTDERGAYRLGEILHDAVVRPVAWRPSDSIRSHLGTFRLRGVTVEVMGALQKRLPDGSWEAPVDVAALRVFVDFEGHRIPVLPLEHEWKAYERMGRTERAALLKRYARPDS